MPIAKKIAYNVVFNAVAKILSTILALVGIGFITRYLGKEGFGDYATILAFFAFFNAIADLGLYSVATREISRENANEKEIMSNVFSLRVFTALLIFILSPVIAFLLPYSENVKSGIILAAGAFVFSSSYMVLNGIFQKNLSMDKVAASELFGKIIQVSFIALAVTLEWSFLAIVFAFVLSMMVNFILVFWLSRKYLEFKLTINFPYWKKFLKLSFPMGASVLITFLYFKLDTILLSIIKDSAAVGIYNAAYKIIENITFFPAMIVGLTLPIISNSIFSNKERFEQISNKTIKVFVLLIVPLVVGTLFLADEVIEIIAGEGFTASAHTLRVLVFALAFIFFGHFFNNILLAGNLQKKLMKVLGLAAFLNITLNLILIPHYSYMGAAAVSVFTEITVVTLTFFLVTRKLKYKPKIENWGKFILSGFFMALFLFLFKGYNFFFLAIASSIIYFLALAATRAITKQELLSIVKK